MSTFSADRFAALWRRLDAQGDAHRLYRRLRRAHRQLWRAYHGEAHVGDCLEKLDAFRHLAGDPDAVEVALWFHDAVYVPWRATNEERSAAWARRELVQAGVGAERVEHVEALILATCHRDPPRPGDEALLVDVDLSILGADEERFARYEREVRREYWWVPRRRFQEARAAVLRSFLERPAIFTTEEIAARYELPARVNLERALATLREP
jgi:predicted metal-dependent HD superfamily phosphohydrolase